VHRPLERVRLHVGIITDFIYLSETIYRYIVMFFIAVAEREGFPRRITKDAWIKMNALTIPA